MMELNFGNCYNPRLAQYPHLDRGENNRRYYKGLEQLFDSIPATPPHNNSIAALRKIILSLNALFHFFGESIAIRPAGEGNFALRTANDLILAKGAFRHSDVWISKAEKGEPVPWLPQRKIRYLVARWDSLLMPSGKWDRKTANWSSWFIEHKDLPRYMDPEEIYQTIRRAGDYKRLRWKPCLGDTLGGSSALKMLLQTAFNGAEAVATRESGCLPFDNPFGEILRGEIASETFENANHCLDNAIFEEKWGRYVPDGEQDLTDSLYSYSDAAEALKVAPGGARSTRIDGVKRLNAEHSGKLIVLAAKGKKQFKIDRAIARRIRHLSGEDITKMK